MSSFHDGRRAARRKRFRTGQMIIGGLAVLSVAACTAFPSADAPPSLEEVTSDLKEFRGPNGLIRMPEANHGQASDLYPTALYIESIGDDLTNQLDTADLLGPDLAQANRLDVLTLWSAVEIQARIGGDPSAQLQRALREANLPAPQQGADAEIGALWLWGDLARTARAIHIDQIPDMDTARDRLAAVQVSAITGKPYLMWRLYDAYKALGSPPPEELTNGMRTMSLPSSPKGYEAVLDTQGVLESRAALGQQLDPSDGLAEHLKKLLDSGVAAEDVLINSILRSLELLGDTRDRDAFAEDLLASRQDSSTGLLTQAGANNGSVQGTYLAARLVDMYFPDIANADTVESLTEALDSEDANPVTRLRALVALKRSGRYDWKQHGALIDAAVQDLPSVVTDKNLFSYLMAVEPLIQLSPELHLAKLTEFDIDMNSVDSQAAGLAAISNATYFSNANKVRSMFIRLQAKIPEIVKNPSEPAVLYYRALTAMTSAAKSGLGSEDFDQATKTLGKYRGCASGESLYRIGFDPDAPCSIAVSTLMLGVPGAYTLGDNR